MLDCYCAASVAMNHNDRKESGIGPHSSKLDMKSKSYKSSEGWNHHHHHHHGSRNSSEDPGISSSRTDKHVLSNVRNHPQAEGHSRSYSSSDSSLRKKTLPSSNHVHNHVLDKLNKSNKVLDSSAPHNGKRRRSLEDKEGVAEVEGDDGEWTEHVSSSSGRTYYYNKKLDKSQWEPPQSLKKKARLDPPPQPVSAHSKSGSTSSNHEVRREEGSRTSSRSRGNSRERGHSHKEKSRRDIGSSGRRDSGSRRGTTHERPGSTSQDRSGGSTQDRGGVAHHESSRKRYRDSRRSVSHSNSSSPVPSKHHSSSGGGSSSSRGHSLKGSSTHKSVTSGRSHGGTRDRNDKSRQATPGCHGNRSAHASPSTSSTPKGSVGTPGIQLISPTTPGNSAGNIPASLSQTLSNTQHLIEQNSLLIEQRQKFLAGENVTVATPTMQMTTPTSTTPNMLVSTPPTHLHQPIARKKLSLNPQITQSPPGGVFPVTLSTPSSVMGGVPYTPTGTPAQTGSSGCGIPTTPQTTPNLHPLQKALLLHNQQQQQQQQVQLSSQVQPLQLTPTPYPSGGVTEQATPTITIPHATPTGIPHTTPSTGPQATPTALPHHMTSLSHPNSPGLQSPLGPPETPPLVSASIHPLTPAQQTVFNMPGVVPSPNIEGVIPMSTYPLVSSVLLQRPVSRLGYQGVSLVDPSYPGGSLLEDMGLASRVDLALGDRGLLSPWALQTETSGKQMEQCRWEAWRRRVVDAAYHSGRLARRRLSLEGAQVRSFSRGQRLACVQSLLMELDKR